MKTQHSNTHHFDTVLLVLSLSARTHTRAASQFNVYRSHATTYVCEWYVLHEHTHTHIAINGTTICWVECASARETERERHCERLQLNWTEKRQNNTLQHRATAKPREERKNVEKYSILCTTPHTIRQRNRGNVCMYRSNVHIQLCVAYGTCEPVSVCVCELFYFAQPIFYKYVDCGIGRSHYKQGERRRRRRIRWRMKKKWKIEKRRSRE